MLDSDDNSGLFTFMVGLTIVVMVGIGLSLLVDGRFNSSKTASESVSQIESGAADLELLDARYQEVSLRLAGAEPRLQGQLRERESTLATLRDLDQRRETFGLRKEDLLNSIQRLEEGFSEYRARYREMVRAAAVGRSLGNLKIRGGREYHQAVITEVTDVGLEIRHENGLARIQAPDLDPDMQDFFQWDDEARRDRLARELANRRMVSSLPETTQPVVEKPKPASAPGLGTPADDEGRETLRRKVRAWEAKVARLDSERNEALANASYGRNSSVSGSLETWQGKAARLGAELVRARAELAAAKAVLAGVAPSDPLRRGEANPR
jgi:hypothetical protein